MSKVNQTFWDRFARIYALFMKRNESAYDAIAEQIKPVLTSEMRALELACGTAQMTRRLSGNVREWIATDYAPNMVAAAQKHFSAANVSYQVADATALPFPDSAFDAVIIANALHIMPEPEAALAEIRRVLKAGCSSRPPLSTSLATADFPSGSLKRRVSAPFINGRRRSLPHLCRPMAIRWSARSS